MKNETNEAHEADETNSEATEANEPTERKIVVPGEVIATGEDFLPGEGARRENEDVVANRFGLAEISGRVIKVIPLFGAFIPRRGNVVIGRVTDLTMRGWVIDIDSADGAFLSLEEYPKYVNKNEMEQHLKIGDVIVAKIWSIGSRGIDLSMRSRGLGKLYDGFIFRVIPARVPRIIGREGSMINIIKEKTGCNITVGQNGWVWIKGENSDDEIRARKAIEFVSDKVYLGGLTEKMEEWFEKN